jgi:hypothetical protein
MVFGREGAQRRGSDADFLKRITQELRGNTPTTLESKYFLGDKDAGKRVKAMVWMLGATGGEEELRFTSGVNALELANERNFDLRAREYRFLSRMKTIESDGDGLLELDSGTNTKRGRLSTATGYAKAVNQFFALAGAVPDASAAVEDAKLLRRTMLDLIGRLPTPLEVQYFVADKDPKKRDQIIDWLVKMDEHARHSADKQKSLHGRAGDDPLGRLLDQLLIDNKPDEEVLVALSLAALARYPSETEKTLLTAQVAKQSDRRAAWREILATLSHLPDAKQHIDGLNRWREGK